MQSRGVIDGESIGTIVITFNVYAIFWGDKKPARSRVLLALPSRIKTAKYQIYTKYMRFNLLLQYFAMKMPPFVLNVFSPLTIKLHYPADEKCVSLQPSDE